MSEDRPLRRTLESLRKEAKQWLRALRAGEPQALERFRQALGEHAGAPTLRIVQHALAREYGFNGWVELSAAATETGAVHFEPMPAALEEMATALLDAYRLGTPEAMERHHRLTWHRRAWSAMRTYVQLDLGKPVDAEITIDDARWLVARECGFESWTLLMEYAERARLGTSSAKPVRVFRAAGRGTEETLARTRDWREVRELMSAATDVGLAANGQMTDALLRDIVKIKGITALDLSQSEQLTDVGLQVLAELPGLKKLDLGGTSVSDAGVAVLRMLPALEQLSLVMTHVTDAGMTCLADCHRIDRLQLSWTNTGDGAIRALAGKERLSHFWSGNHVTGEGLAALHEIPTYREWRGGEERVSLMSFDPGPNFISLRGTFGDADMSRLEGLNGLFALAVDAERPRLSAAALPPLMKLPHLGWLSVDAKDDWMPHLAAMPHLRFLGTQDTVAGDDGFESLSASRSLQFLWGRRCHNLGSRGFRALSRMPALRGLSVSCLNVGDDGLAALPEFPALTELMPMDVPDEGYRFVGACERLTDLILMYCRSTTDLATEHIAHLPLQKYFNSYTTITDRTPELLSRMDTLESVTFDGCHHLTDNGVGALRRLPRLREVRVSGRGITARVGEAFPGGVRVVHTVEA